MTITLRIFGRAVAAVEVRRDCTDSCNLDLTGLAQPGVNGHRPVDRAVKGMSHWWVGRMQA